MRNFKKLIAMGTALAMAIIMNVSAFADGDGTQANPYTNAYDNGAVVVSAIKAALPTMTEGAQYTVVVIPVLGEDEEISDSNIHYINQADRNDPIWATTTTWGTPAALADGTYVVRVGDEAGNVDETYFRVGSTQPPVDPPVDPEPDPEPTYTLGDVDGVAGININDATAVAKHVVGLTPLTGDNLLAADCDGVKGVNINDATAIAKLVVGLIQNLTPVPAE